MPQAAVPAATAAVPAITAGVTAATAAIPAVTAGVTAATAAVPAITAGVTAAVPAITAATAVTPGLLGVAGGTGIPAGLGGIGMNIGAQTSTYIPAAIEALPAAAETIPTALTAAEQLGTTVSMIDSVAGVAEPLANAGPQLQNAVGPWRAWDPAVQFGTKLPTTQVPLAAVGGPGYTAPSTLSPLQPMSLTGPQMSTQPALPSMAEIAAEPIGTGTGMGGSTLGETVYAPTSPAITGTKGLSHAADPWYKGKLAQSIGKGLVSAATTDYGPAQQQQEQAPPTYGSAAPPLNPYRSGHVERQAAFAHSIMELYLAGGGYG